MDCEKFDRVVLDLLYGELDELTRASAKRHTEHCTRCRRISAELRATREVGSLPLVEPPESLEARILELEQQARAELPLGKRVGRVISILASYAMRPQLAMAALLLLLIGSSLLLFRASPGRTNALRVTERGVPETELELAPAASVPAAPAAAPLEMLGRPAPEPSPEPVAAAEAAPDEAAKGSQPAGAALTPFDAASRALAERRFAEAERLFDVLAEQGGPDSARAALKAAEAARDGRGCSAAVERFEQVAARHAGSPGVVQQATWQAAECYRATGRLADARRHYETLVGSDTYRERAQTALDGLGQAVATTRAKRAAAKAAVEAAPPSATAAPGTAGTAPPAAAKPDTKRENPAD